MLWNLRNFCITHSWELVKQRETDSCNPQEVNLAPLVTAGTRRLWILERRVVLKHDARVMAVWRYSPRREGCRGTVITLASRRWIIITHPLFTYSGGALCQRCQTVPSGVPRRVAKVDECCARARGPIPEDKSRKLVFFKHTDKEDLVDELQSLKVAVADQTYHFQLHKVHLVSLRALHRSFHFPELLYDLYSIISGVSGNCHLDFNQIALVVHCPLDLWADKCLQ